MNISRLSQRNKRQKPGHEQQSAASRVLSVYELLEDVLTYLLPKDLRAARLVSPQWHSIIERSQKLNQMWAIRDRYLSIALLGDEGVGKKTLLKHVSIARLHLRCASFDPVLSQWDENCSRRDPMRLSQQQIYLYEELWIVDIEIVPPELHIYQALFKQLLAAHQAYVIIYSMTCRSSFAQVRMWQSRIEHFFSNELELLAIMSTKQDLVEWREVARLEGESEARMLDTQHLETSTPVAAPQAGTLIPIVERYRNSLRRKYNPRSTWTFTNDGWRKNSPSGQERRRSLGAVLKAIAARVKP